LFIACGGGDSAPSAPPTPKIDPTKPAAITLVSGNGQTARIKTAAPSAIVFRVTNGLDAPLSGIPVSFSVSAGGGSLAATNGVSGADGTVTLPSWTLGSAVGTNTVTATVAGGPSASISAKARLPYWTIMLYMAADNTLSGAGLNDLAELAAAGINPEVQVVVEAEFNQRQLAQYGCTAACFGRTNFNTFRFVPNGAPSTTTSVINGPTIDLGNRDMTSPGELRDFIQWGKQNLPAERYSVVLWNHGGGNEGLFEDDTSAPGNIMSLPQLSAALTGIGPIDILDFDMCLMAGYETLMSLRGLASTVVFSEESVPSAGNEYVSFLKLFYNNPTADSRSLAGRLADVFHLSYQTSTETETVSAIDMAGLPAVDAAVSRLGLALERIPTTLTASVSQAAAGAQRFGLAWLVDIADLTDSLRARVTDTAVSNAAAALRQTATSPAFLITAHNRSGTGKTGRDVGRSHGLHIVMPSGRAGDALPSKGPGSLLAYQQLPQTEWTRFLQRWVPGSGATSRNYVDLGTSQLLLYVVWDSALVSHRGDIDLLILEPNGNVYSPLIGTVTPDGLLTADSRDGHTYFEGFGSNRYVEVGQYDFLAWLSEDPANYRPLLNVVYAFGDTPFTSVYNSTNYPRLSLQSSWVNDPNYSYSKMVAGSYTDLRRVAVWNPTAASSSLNPAGSDGEILSADRRGVTAEQLATLTRLRAMKRASITPSSHPATILDSRSSLAGFGPKAVP